MTRPTPDTIYTGDALQLLPTWSARFADVVVADPPYGNACAYGSSRRTIAGDEHPLIGAQGIAASHRALRRDATAYVFCGAKHLGLLQHFFACYSRFRLREVLVWDKGRPGYGSTFRRSYENILVLEKGRPRYRETTIATVLAHARADTRLHPHAKPVALLQRLIRASSDEGGIVLDPFAGSGSTGVAAVTAGRRFVGIEVDPGYAEIARARLRDATPNGRAA